MVLLFCFGLSAFKGNHPNKNHPSHRWGDEAVRQLLAETTDAWMLYSKWLFWNVLYFPTWANDPIGRAYFSSCLKQYCFGGNHAFTHSFLLVDLELKFMQSPRIFMNFLQIWGQVYEANAGHSSTVVTDSNWYIYISVGCPRILVHGL